MLNKLNNLIDSSPVMSRNYFGSDEDFLEYCLDLIYYKMVSLNKFGKCSCVSITVRDINSGIIHLRRDGVWNESPKWGTLERMTLLCDKLKSIGFSCGIILDVDTKDPTHVFLEVPRCLDSCMS